MSSRYNQLLFGDPATLQNILADGSDLSAEEMRAALSNICGQIMRLDAELCRPGPAMPTRHELAGITSDHKGKDNG
jgi:hypothetical protein